MSRYRRSSTRTTYFFTVVAFQRRPILCDPAVTSALREAIASVRATRPFSIDAWVQMPDHLHCIWTLPDGDRDFSSRWRLIKRRVSVACGEAYLERHLLGFSRRSRHESTIWQRRFWEHQIRNERDYERHFDYIHFNPVKHGHVGSAGEWAYSTFHRHVRDGIYAADWGGSAAITDLHFE